MTSPESSIDSVFVKLVAGNDIDDYCYTFSGGCDQLLWVKGMGCHQFSTDALVIRSKGAPAVISSALWLFESLCFSSLCPCLQDLVQRTYLQVAAASVTSSWGFGMKFVLQKEASSSLPWRQGTPLPCGSTIQICTMTYCHVLHCVSD